jgi:hypothetical protein
MSWRSGMPTIMAKVIRSRRIWMNSLFTTARKRRKENSRQDIRPAPGA